ncbi:MAG: PqqD family protein [Deltaproteobacteria bacterium]|nr:PqqD family protein [Deltaproteobacteria bacterium]
MEPRNLKDLIFSKKDDFVTREIAGETIIVPIRKQAGDLESIYTLNEIGTVIWGMIDGKTKVRQIIEAIHQNYTASPEEAAKDVAEFLQSLKEAGLIQSSK